MRKIDSALRAISEVSISDKNSLDIAVSATRDAIKSLDAGSEEDASLAQELILSFESMVTSKQGESRSISEKATQQIRQAKAYMNAGNSALGRGILQGTYEGAVEHYDHMIAFLESARDAQKSFVEALYGQQGAKIRWVALEVFYKNHVEEDVYGIVLKSAQSLRDEMVRSLKTL